MQYITMVCDIKESCKLEDREAVQMHLIATLKQLNSEFKDAIASPFLITLGDEWQGLLYGTCDYNEVLRFLHKKMPGLSFCTGIGIGEVTIHNFELTVNQLDGPSFHKARKAVTLAKQLGYSLVLIK